MMPILTEWQVRKMSDGRYELRQGVDKTIREFDHYPSEEEVNVALSMARVMIR